MSSPLTGECEQDIVFMNIWQSCFVNAYEEQILLFLAQDSRVTQRELSRRCECSLGIVNKSIQKLLQLELINADYSLRPSAHALLEESKPKRAIILAAGYGIRMVPINTEIPKGLLKVRGDILIERLIRQLHEVGVDEIIVVVGYMKESYEYLIDAYGATLVVNMEYSSKNNFYSLSLVSHLLESAYILPCDLWCKDNPFQAHELHSWYLITDEKKRLSTLRVGRNGMLLPTKEGGNAMMGIAFIHKDEAEGLKNKLEEFVREGTRDDAYWEEALFSNPFPSVQAKVANHGSLIEINTYEQLRAIDSTSDSLASDAINTICTILGVKEGEIYDISVMKKGMTNRSFLFTCRDQRYVMRIPGEGTDNLINRKQEHAVYTRLQGTGLTDTVIFMNPKNGYKITEFLCDARVCDPLNPLEVEACMVRLKEFHDLDLQVDHEFDLFEQIEFYESLWNGKPSVYRDYLSTKKNVLSLRPFIEKHVVKKVLTHIDAVPDNFLLRSEKDPILLIDWEYAGMQDPHVDIAMFAIYSFYSREQIDRLIEMYFQGHAPFEQKLKIYAYIAACGLLWSNWSEYKRNLGVEYGEYALKQYRYAKDFYRIVHKEGLNE